MLLLLHLKFPFAPSAEYLLELSPNPFGSRSAFNSVGAITHGNPQTISILFSDFDKPFGSRSLAPKQRTQFVFPMARLADRVALARQYGVENRRTSWTH